MPRTAFNIFNWCANPSPSFSGSAASNCNVNYSKTITGGNDPSISERMRYAQLVKTSKYRRVIQRYTVLTQVQDNQLYTIAAGQVRPFSLVI